MVQNVGTVATHDTGWNGIAAEQSPVVAAQQLQLAVYAEEDEIGHLAFDGGVTVLELATRKASLEETFMQLTGDGQQFAFGEAS